MLLTDFLLVHYVLSGAIAGAVITLAQFIPSEHWIWGKKKQRYPRCFICHKEGDCSKNTMKLHEVEEKVSIYLCPTHYEVKEDAEKLYWSRRK
jgi:hypothetical protein